MRLALFADVHLGHRRYTRSAPNGINQHEMDVARAFRLAVDGILEAKPDLVLGAGDLFHMTRPSPAAIVFAVRELKRLREAGLPVVLVNGNHETGRTSDLGASLRILSEIGGVEVATDEARQIVYPALDCRVTAAPYSAVIQGEVPIPEGSERYQVLLAHAEVQGAYQRDTDVRPCGQLATDVLEWPGWSAICLGDYHICHRVSERAYYPGSLEFTSSNPWEEAEIPKGWLLWDLASGAVELQPIGPARLVRDLGVLDAIGMTASELDQAIAERMETVEVADAILRLKSVNVPLAVQRQLDHGAHRHWRAQALHFDLRFQKPERVASGLSDRPFQRQPLSEVVAAFLAGYPLAPGLDRSRFTEIGSALMAETDELSETKREVA